MQHPVHFWFLHDLRTIKRSMIALASQVPEKTKDNNGYRPVPDEVQNELATLPRDFLEACGYTWHNDIPRKLQFLRDCRENGLTSLEVCELQEIPEFIFRMPHLLNKILEKCGKIILFGGVIVLSPLWVTMFCIMFFIIHGLKDIEKSLTYLRKSFHRGLAKIIPENIPESKVLGTKQPPRKQLTGSESL